MSPSSRNGLRPHPSSSPIPPPFKPSLDEVLNHLRKQLLKRDEPTSITIEARDFRRLWAELSDKEKRRIAYDSSKSKLVLHMVGFVHETVTHTLLQGFYDAYLQLPLIYRNKIRIETNSPCIRFGGEYRGSRKIPDIGVQGDDEYGIPQMRLIVEIGVSQTYESLVVVVSLSEFPAYSSPDPSRLVDVPVEEMGQTLFRRVESPLGPIEFEGITWFGSISAFVEMWAKDPVTGSARLASDRMDLFTSDSPVLGLHLSDIVPIPSELDRPIKFEWGNMQITKAMKMTAIERYQIATGDRADAGDSNYVP
ncbi:MAG: hypothetical protein M1840_005623 [Geoglossum simile]|nr:MAG: hypothetical protein M1840_005623 [Geoglossum simile]